MAPRGNEEHRAPGSPAEDARERILATAYDLFARDGIRAVGIDRIIRDAGVAKMTLYRHFRSKDDLVLAVLERRQELWTRGWLVEEIERMADGPAEQLLAIFDALDEWFHRPDYESCLFISTLLETTDRESPLRAASAAGLDDVRAVVRQRAVQAGIADPESFASQWQVLMSGAIIAANWGDLDAAKRAKEAGELLVAERGVAAAS